MTAKVKRRSSGILAYRQNSSDELEVLLVHPGGPFWAKRDEGAWSVPKGEFDEQLEQPVAATPREFAEETGITLPEREWLSLGSLKQPSGKVVDAWAGDLDVDVSDMRFSTFTMEWPPKSGRIAEFPEVDRAEWFDLGTAGTKILPGQVGFLDALVNAVGGAAIVTDAKPSGKRSRPSPDKLDAFKWLRDEELNDPDDLPEPWEVITEVMTGYSVAEWVTLPSERTSAMAQLGPIITWFSNGV